MSSSSRLKSSVVGFASDMVLKSRLDLVRTEATLSSTSAVMPTESRKTALEADGSTAAGRRAARCNDYSDNLRCARDVDGCVGLGGCNRLEGARLPRQVADEVRDTRECICNRPAERGRLAPHQCCKRFVMHGILPELAAAAVLRIARIRGQTGLASLARPWHSVNSADTLTQQSLLAFYVFQAS